MVLKSITGDVSYSFHSGDWDCRNQGPSRPRHRCMCMSGKSYFIKILRGLLDIDSCKLLNNPTARYSAGA